MISLIATALLMAGAEPPPAAKSPPAPKMRCKREVETGSLARVKKTCHTEAEWEAIRRDAQEAGGRLVGPGFRPSPASGGGG